MVAPRQRHLCCASGSFLRLSLVTPPPVEGCGHTLPADTPGDRTEPFVVVNRVSREGAVDLVSRGSRRRFRRIA
jgi:hypothetical protein